MRNQYHQISLKNTFSDCQGMFREDTPSFFQVSASTLDIPELSPTNFIMSYTNLSNTNTSIL